jgi:DNA-binding response OmpR family regulator
VRQRPAVILYVEQNRLLLESVEDVLEFAGWYVRPCYDEGYAVAYVESAQHHFDLLLIDNELRGLSGLKLTERAADSAPAEDSHHPHLFGRHQRGGGAGGGRRVPPEA